MIHKQLLWSCYPHDNTFLGKRQNIELFLSYVLNRLRDHYTHQKKYKNI